jgi:hypothetical protein
MSKTKGEPSSEGAYFFRLTCSHFREGIKYIKDIDEYKEIVEFINTLEPEIIDNYNTLKKIYIPWENSFVFQKIKPIRDKFFHYPNLKDDTALIDKLLNELKDTKTGLSSSGIVKDLRLEFGDELANAYALEHFVDLDDFKNTMKILVEAVKQMPHRWI